MTEVLDLRRSRSQGQNEYQLEEAQDDYSGGDFEYKKPKKGKGLIKTLLVVFISVVVTTIGIKASDKLFGPGQEQANNSLCSEDMTFIPNSAGGFCVDKYEASTGKNCPNLNPANQDDSRTNVNTQECFAVSKKDAIPWRNISQNQAAVACAKAGKRLPTNKEWLQASLGTPDKDAFWGKDDCQVANNWDKQPGLTGSGKNCISSVGAYDMVGNVWEWVEETINEGEYKGIKLPGEGYIKGIDAYGMPTETNAENPDLNYNKDYLWIKNSGTKGILKGGYWSNKQEGGIYSLYLVFDPSFAGESVGFRCVK